MPPTSTRGSQMSPVCQAGRRVCVCVCAHVAGSVPGTVCLRGQGQAGLQKGPCFGSRTFPLRGPALTMLDPQKCLGSFFRFGARPSKCGLCLLAGFQGWREVIKHWHSTWEDWTPGPLPPHSVMVLGL